MCVKPPKKTQYWPTGDYYQEGGGNGSCHIVDERRRHIKCRVVLDALDHGQGRRPIESDVASYAGSGEWL